MRSSDHATEPGNDSTTLPTRLGSVVSESRFRLPPLDVAAAEARRLKYLARQDAEDARQAAAAWARVVARMGRRYAECTIDSFVVARDKANAQRQRFALDRLRRLVGEIDAEIADGRNVVLFGPVGTGKDHLLAALMRAACEAGHVVEWINGMDLFGNFRDRIDADNAETEAQALARWTAPDVLAISDPLPPWGALTAYQAQMLFRLIDRRYRDRKPVWVTANFADGKEAGERLGVQVLDRIKDGAVELYCAWPSYRRASE